MASTPTITALLSSFLLFLLFSPSSANDGNILISGDVLAADSQLSAGDAVFVIQNDCNLVLYNNGDGFHSNTSGRSSKCTLTLTDFGQLIVTDVMASKAVWSTPRSNTRGQYAAILQPDGEVGIYGPAVWSTPSPATTKAVKAADEMTGDEPRAPRNLLFSSEVLTEGEKVASRDYKLEVTEKCGLRLTKSAHVDNMVVWESSKIEARENCFARLNFHGQLSLLDDDGKVLWTTKRAAAKGQYVLAVKINGKATIYGPRIWSTAK